MGELAFEEQRKAYQMHGYAIDPSSQSAYASQYVVNPEMMAEMAMEKKVEKRKRLPKGEPSNDSFMGPWAKYEDELVEAPPAPTLVMQYASSIQ
jgi:hypothetical protein